MPKYFSASPAPVDVFDVALLDLDGVVYIGDHAVPGAADALAAARRSGITTPWAPNAALDFPSVGLLRPVCLVSICSKSRRKKRRRN